MLTNSSSTIPPGWAPADAVAALMEPDAGRRIQHDLEEFKKALESGRLAAQPSPNI